MPGQDLFQLANDESFLNYCFGRNEQDVRYWEQWLGNHPEYSAQVLELKSALILLANEAKEKEAEAQFEQLKQRIAAAGRQKSAGKSGYYLLFTRLAVAASLLIVCTTGIFLYRKHQQETRQKSALAVKANVRPGSNKAYLTLSDGRKISLNDAQNGAIAKQSGIVITKEKDGQLIYAIQPGEKPEASSPGAAGYNVIETPRGGQYQVRLPDGTNVWLNAASSLKYPADFHAKRERRVELSGEGYFEVAKDKAHPFVVVSDMQEVTVLGTHFNIKAYKDESGISTTLLEGSVQVKGTINAQQKMLQPGEQSHISRTNGLISISSVNTDDIIAWKRGYFIFDNQDITSIMRVISRWYDVDVEYRSFNREARFGGTFSKSSDLSEIFKNLEMLGNTHFKINGRRVIISDTSAK